MRFKFLSMSFGFMIKIWFERPLCSPDLVQTQCHGREEIYWRKGSLSSRPTCAAGIDDHHEECGKDAWKEKCQGPTRRFVIIDAIVAWRVARPDRAVS